MKAVVLAAGEGSRLRPFTEVRPKVMLPVANRPILEYKVRSLASLGIDEIVLVVGYRREKVQSYFEDGGEWGVDIEYVVQEEQLGTAHALEQVEESVDGRFLVLNGDNLIHPGAIERLVEGAEEGCGMLLKQVDDTEGYGEVEVESGRVIDIEEKPLSSGGGAVNLGIYLFTEGIFDAIRETKQSPRGEYDITDSIQRMVEDGSSVKGVKTSETWMDAVYPWDLVEVNEAVLEEGGELYVDFENRGRVEEGATVKGPVALGEGSVIRSGAYVRGPVVIGKGSEVGPNATILPATSVGDNVSVGPGSVVQGSVLMEGSRVGSCSNLSSSLLASGVSLGSQVSADSGEAEVTVKERVHRVKGVGGLFADGAEVGSGVTVRPGRMVGRDAEVLSGAVVRESVESGSRLTV